jgi:MHS family citrate/tricarballylate:H+ symporter-like MFS transporter
MNGSFGVGPQLQRRHIAAIVAGNGLEFYDFLVYAFFAVQIGRSLFPTSGGNDLLFSLGTFGAGFIARPIGGLVLGGIADRRGRKPAMVLAFALMGVANIGLVLTPSYAAIGVAAPLLALAFRMLQGFALGGEVGPSTAYLLEAAPPGRRGLYISFQYATQEAAILAAGVVGLVLASLLTAAQLDAWGWRVAFALGTLIIPFGLVVRQSLPETLSMEALTPPSVSAVRPQAVVGIAGLLLIGAGTLTHYTLDYLTTFAQTTLHMAVRTAFGATLVLGTFGLAACLAGGLLSDKYGRKRALVGPWIGLAFMGVPAFLTMSYFRTPVALLVTTAVLSTLLSLSSVPALILVAEALPQRARASSLGIIYALAIMTFGGTAQFVVAFLIRVLASPLAPAWYMTAALAVGLIGIALLKEQRPAASFPTIGAHDGLSANSPGTQHRIQATGYQVP